MEISLSSPKFYYGMRLRPFDIASQPKGHVEYIEPDQAPKDLVERWDSKDYRHGIVVYPKALSKRDIEHYSLTDFNARSDSELFAQFKQYAEDMIEYEIEFDEFAKEHLHPKGEMRNNMPLHFLKLPDLFKLTKKFKAGHDLRTMKIWYDKL